MRTPVHPFQVTDTVGEIVARRPALSRLFEQAGIDYCCGGRKPLEEACRMKGIDAAAFLATLEDEAAQDSAAPLVNASDMSLAELSDHIERTHHATLKSELPRLGALAEKVAMVHGESDPRLRGLFETFQSFVRDLIPHMAREEEVVFPGIRAGSASTDAIRRLESEHDGAGAAMAKMRELTDGYRPPEWACNSYRALLDGLARIERDMHEHVHKENNVLFPRALEGRPR